MVEASFKRLSICKRTIAAIGTILFFPVERMDRFAARQTFVAVAEKASFSAAARRLGIAKSAVSRQVAELEGALGVRLINGATRSLSLTEVGRSYFERAERILADLDDADRAAGDTRAAPCGRLRISAPMSFGVLHLAPALSDFLARYPSVTVDLALNDRFVERFGPDPYGDAGN